MAAAYKLTTLRVGLESVRSRSMQQCGCHSGVTFRTAFSSLRVSTSAHLRLSSRFLHARVASTRQCCRSTGLSLNAAGAAIAPQGVDDPQQVQSVHMDGPGAQIDLQLPRRRLQVSFTCNKCGARSERVVNPLAWEHGTVFLQCTGCEAWHNVRDAAGLIEEVHLADKPADSIMTVEHEARQGNSHHAAAQPAQDELNQENSSGGQQEQQQVAQQVAPVGSPAGHNGAQDSHQSETSPVPVRDRSAPIPVPENVDCGDEEACELDW